VNLVPFRPVAQDVLALCDPLMVNETEFGGALGRRIRGRAEVRSAVAELAGA
jgi:ribokinase